MCCSPHHLIKNIYNFSIAYNLLEVIITSTGLEVNSKQFTNIH